MKCIFTLLMTFWGLLLSPVADAALWTITYPRPIDDTDARTEYPIALLKLALEKTGVNYGRRTRLVPERDSEYVSTIFSKKGR